MSTLDVIEGLKAAVGAGADLSGFTAAIHAKLDALQDAGPSPPAPPTHTTESAIEALARGLVDSALTTLTSGSAGRTARTSSARAVLSKTRATTAVELHRASASRPGVAHAAMVSAAAGVHVGHLVEGGAASGKVAAKHAVAFLEAAAAAAAGGFVADVAAGKALTEGAAGVPFLLLAHTLTAATAARAAMEALAGDPRCHANLPDSVRQCTRLCDRLTKDLASTCYMTPSPPPSPPGGLSSLAHSVSTPTLPPLQGALPGLSASRPSSAPTTGVDLAALGAAAVAGDGALVAAFSPVENAVGQQLVEGVTRPLDTEWDMLSRLGVLPVERNTGTEAPAVLGVAAASTPGLPSSAVSGVVILPQSAVEVAGGVRQLATVFGGGRLRRASSSAHVTVALPAAVAPTRWEAPTQRRLQDAVPRFLFKLNRVIARYLPPEGGETPPPAFAPRAGSGVPPPPLSPGRSVRSLAALGGSVEDRLRSVDDFSSALNAPQQLLAVMNGCHHVEEAAELALPALCVPLTLPPGGGGAAVDAMPAPGPATVLATSLQTAYRRLASEFTDRLVRATVYSVLPDIAQRRWEHFQPFLKATRSSYGVQVLNYQLRALVFDLQAVCGLPRFPDAPAPWALLREGGGSELTAVAVTASAMVGTALSSCMLQQAELLVALHPSRARMSQLRADAAYTACTFLSLLPFACCGRPLAASRLAALNAASLAVCRMLAAVSLTAGPHEPVLRAVQSTPVAAPPASAFSLRVHGDAVHLPPPLQAFGEAMRVVTVSPVPASHDGAALPRFNPLHHFNLLPTLRAGGATHADMVAPHAVDGSMLLFPSPLSGEEVLAAVSKRHEVCAWEYPQLTEGEEGVREALVKAGVVGAKA